MSLDQLPPFLHDFYEVHEWRHATAILATDYPNELRDVTEVLTAFRLKRSYKPQFGHRSPILLLLVSRLSLPDPPHSTPVLPAAQEEAPSQAFGKKEARVRVLSCRVR